VHYGFIDQGYGPSKAAPWRAGANENTTIGFSHDVTIGGKTLKAGTYGLFLDVEKDGAWNWIFSHDANNWGSYFYDQSKDALRVETYPQESAFTEWLTFGFDDRLSNATTAYLQWENKRASGRFVVLVDDDIDPANMADVMWAVCTRCDPQTSIEIAANCWSSPIDPRLSPDKRAAGDFVNSRAIIDACRPFAWRDKYPKVHSIDPAYRDEIKAKWKELFN
jgi:hypothetical protein